MLRRLLFLSLLKLIVLVILLWIFLLGCDRSKLEAEFYGFLECVSPKAMQLINKIVDGEVKERFFYRVCGEAFA
jgi:hypothetical protein